MGFVLYCSVGLIRPVSCGAPLLTPIHRYSNPCLDILACSSFYITIISLVYLRIQVGFNITYMALEPAHHSSSEYSLGSQSTGSNSDRYFNRSLTWIISLIQKESCLYCNWSIISWSLALFLVGKVTMSSFLSFSVPSSRMTLEDPKYFSHCFSGLHE
jgi:hypothetical protein